MKMLDLPSDTEGGAVGATCWWECKLGQSILQRAIW